MKVLLFKDGQDGVITHLPGEYPWPELCDLLGGEIDTTPINGRLALVTRRDAEIQDLPQHYSFHIHGRADRKIVGDCAVIAVRADGTLTDISTFGMMQAAIAVSIPCVQKGAGNG